MIIPHISYSHRKLVFSSLWASCLKGIPEGLHTTISPVETEAKNMKTTCWQSQFLSSPVEWEPRTPVQGPELSWAQLHTVYTHLDFIQSIRRPEFLPCQLQRRDFYKEGRRWPLCGSPRHGVPPRGRNFWGRHWSLRSAAAAPPAGSTTRSHLKQNWRSWTNSPGSRQNRTR